MMVTVEGRAVFLPSMVEVDFLMDLGEVLARLVDLLRDLVEELMLG